MPGPAHETLVALLAQRPDLLDLLLRTLGRPGLPTNVEAADSTLTSTPAPSFSPFW